MKSIKELIRRTNFYLFQLARPEYIFFCRKLPKSYIMEYLNGVYLQELQENF